MDDQSNIDDNDLSEFKNEVKTWLSIDEEIVKHETKIKELKKIKNKILQPKITKFMVNYNIKDLNTINGKIRCNERNTKKPLNKKNIRENLSQVITDNSQIDQAMQLIMNNREITKTYILTKPKNKIYPKNSLPIDS